MTLDENRIHYEGIRRLETGVYLFGASPRMRNFYRLYLSSV